MKRRRHGYLGGECGAAAMELLVWLPLLIELMLITADVSTLYWRQAEMWTVARDVTRQAARGEFGGDGEGAADRAQVEAAALGRLPHADIATYAFDATNEVHILVLSAQASRISIIGSMVSDFDRMRVRSVMAAEP